MYELRLVTPEKYGENLRKELQEYGLEKAVEKRCDAINDICGFMNYASRGCVQEMLSEILDLVREGSRQ